MSIEFSGVFEKESDGSGTIRSAKNNYSARPEDPFMPRQLVERFSLRSGEEITGIGSRNGAARRPNVENVSTIQGAPPEHYADRPRFEDLTPINPNQPVKFETPGGPVTMRVVDLLTPIGLGQRGLIVAPPRTGKTVLLQQMAKGVADNHPQAYVMVLLIDERPEEVTEMQRTIRGEVIASSNDRDIASHVRIGRLMIDRAKRLVEGGRDVFVLLDSLTRLGRAYNANIRGGGRIMSGGLDIRALIEPKSIFGAARKIENGGSLTIIASALIDTGSRMDEVIFNEFKGTGNMEIVLSRDMANRRVFPAIDLSASGTRKEEQLLSPEALKVSQQLRRTMVDQEPIRAMETLLAALQKTPDNATFVSGFNARGYR